MQKMTIGNIFQNLRLEYRLTRKIICHGLCKIQTLTRYEQGIRIPNLFLEECLLQRLGKTRKQFEQIIDTDTFDLKKRRNRIEQAVKHKDYENAEKEIGAYRQIKKATPHIHNQYLAFELGQIQEQKGQYAEAQKCYMEALQYTKCENALQNMSEYLLSTCELELIYHIAGIKNLLGDQQESKSIYTAMRCYFDQYPYMKDNELYFTPFLLTQLAKIAFAENNQGDSYRWIQEALSLLLTEYKIAGVREALDLFIEIRKKYSIEDDIMNAKIQTMSVALSILELNSVDPNAINVLIKENKWENIMKEL